MLACFLCITERLNGRDEVEVDKIDIRVVFDLLQRSLRIKVTLRQNISINSPGRLQKYLVINRMKKQKLQKVATHP